MIIQPTTEQWDAFVASQPHSHILQTSAWGKLKSNFGWSSDRVAVLCDDHIVAGAQVLFRSLPLRLGTLAYIPKGPLLDFANEDTTSELLRGLDRLVKRHRSILLKIEPDCPDDPVFANHLATIGFRPSPQTVQPPRTIVIDIARSDDEILAAMHQKTRYNIRLATKKDVVVREAQLDDLPAFNALMQTTGERDGFAVHSAEYYAAAYRLFVPMGQAQLLVATYQAQVIAGIFVFAQGDRGWYFYGASGEAERQRMPNYALQWAGMQWAKARGCGEYDLWGVPDEDEATLEAHHLERHDDLWGVYRFKRGFGGKLMRYAGAFDRVYDPLLYKAYELYLKSRGRTEEGLVHERSR
jgi:lipid II:glycine glycyltransferase (peptidoglycan interpeptide bridge formation enzyme)